MNLIQSAKALLGATGTSKIIVAASGGKDSVVTLDTVVRSGKFDEVHAFFMYFVEGLQCEDAPILRMEKRFPTVKFHRVVHHEIVNALRDGAFGCRRVTMRRRMKLGDIEDIIKARTGAEWIAYGQKASDGVVRNAMLKKISGIDIANKRVYPIWNWKIADIRSHIKSMKYIMPPLIGGGSQGSVSFDPRRLLWLRDNFPSDYKKVLGVFPLCESAVYRWEHGLAHDARGRYYVPKEQDDENEAPG